MSPSRRDVVGWCHVGSVGSERPPREYTRTRYRQVGLATSPKASHGNGTHQGHQRKEGPFREGGQGDDSGWCGLGLRGIVADVCLALAGDDGAVGDDSRRGHRHIHRQRDRRKTRARSQTIRTPAAQGRQGGDQPSPDRVLVVPRLLSFPSLHQAPPAPQRRLERSALTFSRLLQRLMTTSSTRRFLARPSSVSFEAIGFSGP